jgi:hypothetical protein
MELTEKNGRIYNEKNELAVIINTNYGAGWSTWNKQYPQCLFDPDCVRSILSGERNHQTIAEEKWEEGSWFGQTSNVVWIPEFTKFIIDEYDGWEDIKYPKDFVWIEA